MPLLVIAGLALPFRCAPGYYGNPLLIGSTCKKCDCSGNSDPNLIFEDCDEVTGQCRNCLRNTTGFKCERCAPGYYGDARFAKNCTGIVYGLVQQSQPKHSMVYGCPLRDQRCLIQSSHTCGPRGRLCSWLPTWQDNLDFCSVESSQELVLFPLPRRKSQIPDSNISSTWAG